MHQADDILTPYYRLNPEELIKVVESIDLVCDGRLLALNSYENRVYQVGIEDSEPLIAKVYRPGRWSRSPRQRRPVLGRTPVEENGDMSAGIANPGTSA